MLVSEYRVVQHVAGYKKDNLLYNLILLTHKLNAFWHFIFKKQYIPLERQIVEPMIEAYFLGELFTARQAS